MKDAIGNKLKEGELVQVNMGKDFAVTVPRFNRAGEGG